MRSITMNRRTVARSAVIALATLGLPATTAATTSPTSAPEPEPQTEPPTDRIDALLVGTIGGRRLSCRVTGFLSGTYAELFVMHRDNEADAVLWVGPLDTLGVTLLASPETITALLDD